MRQNSVFVHFSVNWHEVCPSAKKLSYQICMTYIQANPEKGIPLCLLHANLVSWGTVCIFCLCHSRFQQLSGVSLKLTSV